VRQYDEQRSAATADEIYLLVILKQINVGGAAALEHAFPTTAGREIGGVSTELLTHDVRFFWRNGGPTVFAPSLAESAVDVPVYTQPFLKLLVYGARDLPARTVLSREGCFYVARPLVAREFATRILCWLRAAADIFEKGHSLKILGFFYTPDSQKTVHGRKRPPRPAGACTPDTGRLEALIVPAAGEERRLH
jgi:hypothetical protein